MCPIDSKRHFTDTFFHLPRILGVYLLVSNIVNQKFRGAASPPNKYLSLISRHLFPECISHITYANSYIAFIVHDSLLYCTFLSLRSQAL